MTVNQSQIERWGLFEISLEDNTGYENPFTDVTLEAEFYTGGEGKRVPGFYDGNGIWRIRYMPGQVGIYTFRTISNASALDGKTGTFEAVWPERENHGPVKAKGARFYYADETPAFISGTTAYAWWYLDDAYCGRTLRALRENRFNKLRMLVFPKNLVGMSQIELSYEPPCLPFEKRNGAFDFSRPVPAYFQLLERRVLSLMGIGVQADVILFHHYDFGRWGIDEAMTDPDALQYVSYLMARLGAFRNVWWSLANEYDIAKLPNGDGAFADIGQLDWDRIGEFIQRNDPYGHLRSIHNCGPIYPNRDWLTHVSYQYPGTYSLLMALKNTYQKPVVNDEYQYEGNVKYGWGNCSGKQELTRHWLSFMAGGYATHGETYRKEGNSRDIFWTYGGDLVGESASRIRFLREIAESMPFERMEPDLTLGDGLGYYCLREGYLNMFFFYTFDCPVEDRIVWLGLTDGHKRKYMATIYDLWEKKTLSAFEWDGLSFTKMNLPKEGLIGVQLRQIG